MVMFTVAHPFARGYGFRYSGAYDADEIASAAKQLLTALSEAGGHAGAAEINRRDFIEATVSGTLSKLMDEAVAGLNHHRPPRVYRNPKLEAVTQVCARARFSRPICWLVHDVVSCL